MIEKNEVELVYREGKEMLFEEGGWGGGGAQRGTAARDVQPTVDDTRLVRRLYKSRPPSFSS